MFTVVSILIDNTAFPAAGLPHALSQWSAVQPVFPWATAEEAHMSKGRKQAKCKILYEHMTAALK